MANINEAVRPFWGRSTNPERLAATLSALRPGDNVLDIGAARGAYVRSLSESGYEVKACDLVRYDEWKEFPKGTFEQVTGDILPYADDSFEVTIAFEVLEHVKDVEMFLSEVKRVTRRAFVMSVPNCDQSHTLRRYNLIRAHWEDRSHVNFFTKDTIKSLLENRGFEVESVLDAVRISPADFFLDTVRIPGPIPTKIKNQLRRAAKSICNRYQLVETLWSSILVTCMVDA